MHRDDIRSTPGGFFINKPAQSCGHKSSRSETASAEDYD